MATHHYPIDGSTFAWYKGPILGGIKLLNLLVLRGSRDNPPLGTILSNKIMMMDNSSSWLIQEISIRGAILGNKIGVLKLHAVLKLATDRNLRPSRW
jgi:hypothetical protein